MHQTRLSAGCASTLLVLLLNSAGFSGEDPWLKYTTEAAQLQRDGLYSEAEAKYVSAYRAVVDTAESGRLGRSLNDLANVYIEMGRYADAETAAQRALKVFQETSDPKNPGVAIAQTTLAEIYRIQGKWAAAEQLCIQAIAAYEAVTPTNANALGLAAALNNFAILRLNQQRPSVAEPLLKRVLGILEGILGAGDPAIGTTLNNLTSAYLLLGRYVDAEIVARRALAVLEQAQIRHPVDLALTIQNLAYLSVRREQYAEAEALYKRALDILARALGPQHANLAAILIHLGEVYLHQGRHTEAEALLRRALEIRLAAFGPDSFPVAEVLYDQALLFRKLKRKSEAKKLETRALAIQAAHARENLESYTVDVSALQAGQKRH